MALRICFEGQVRVVKISCFEVLKVVKKVQGKDVTRCSATREGKQGLFLNVQIWYRSVLAFLIE